jgi:hypothetical protein
MHSSKPSTTSSILVRYPNPFLHPSFLGISRELSIIIYNRELLLELKEIWKPLKKIEATPI